MQEPDGNQNQICWDDTLGSGLASERPVLAWSHVHDLQTGDMAALVREERGCGRGVLDGHLVGVRIFEFHGIHVVQVRAALFHRRGLLVGACIRRPRGIVRP